MFEKKKEKKTWSNKDLRGFLGSGVAAGILMNERSGYLIKSMPGDTKGFHAINKSLRQVKNRRSIPYRAFLICHLAPRRNRSAET